MVLRILVATAVIGLWLALVVPPFLPVIRDLGRSPR